jgi:hypothetical protein
MNARAMLVIGMLTEACVIAGGDNFGAKGLEYLIVAGATFAVTVWCLYVTWRRGGFTRRPRRRRAA